MNFKEALTAQLKADAIEAERSTQCRRRGSGARLARVHEEYDRHKDVARSKSTLLPCPTLHVNGPSPKGPGCTVATGGCGCCHAEIKLILDFMSRPFDGDAMLLSTMSPCTQCAHAIALCGRIDRVVFFREYDTDPGGLRVLDSYEIPWQQPTLGFSCSTDAGVGPT